MRGGGASPSPSSLPLPPSADAQSVGAGVTTLQPPRRQHRAQPFRGLTFRRLHTTLQGPSQERFLEEILNMQIPASASDSLQGRSAGTSAPPGGGEEIYIETLALAGPGVREHRAAGMENYCGRLPLGWPEVGRRRRGGGPPEDLEGPQSQLSVGHDKGPLCPNSRRRGQG